jgi:type VI protein secretion system component Hcp
MGYVFLEMDGIKDTGYDHDKDTVGVFARKKNYMIVTDASFGLRSGISDGETSYFDLPLTKHSCPASMDLVKLLASGKEIKWAKIHFFINDKPGGSNTNAKADYWYEITDVKVIAADIGSDNMDQIALGYRTFKYNGPDGTSFSGATT